MAQYIAYYRTSTKKQSISLEAQEKAVKASLRADDVLIDSFEEQESGSRSDRPELTKAIEQCKETGATLLIAKLDRLSRNLHFITNLMESKVEFKALDLPEANKLTIHIIAAMAEHELESIRKRTKTALDQIKKNIEDNGFHLSKKGNAITSLGNADNFSNEGRYKGMRVRSKLAQKNPNTRAAKHILELLKDKDMTLQQKADYLNSRGYKTARGKQYTPTQIKRLS